MVPCEYSSEAPEAFAEARSTSALARHPALSRARSGGDWTIWIFVTCHLCQQGAGAGTSTRTHPPQRRTARHTSVQYGRHDALRALRRLARGEDRAPRALRHEGARRSDDSYEADGRVRARGSPLHRRVRCARSRRHLLRQVRSPILSHDRNRARYTTSATAIPRDGCGRPVGIERCALLNRLDNLNVERSLRFALSSRPPRCLIYRESP
jgi:hypothetical protein